jgi:hypothetical protein
VGRALSSAIPRAFLPLYTWASAIVEIWKKFLQQTLWREYLMGFFDFFSPSPDESSGQNGASSQPESGIIKGRDSTFPLVFIKRLKPHINGTRMQLYCYIVNSWSKEVELDKIRIFGTKRELDTALRPHEEREFLIYDGPVLTREHYESELIYKTREKGDYFETVHKMTFAYNSNDKTYLPSDIHVEGPVRDIYETGM